ncbi:MAG: endonuclease domain-containing protein [Gammaproteobacteria bacterium]|nr:endonuclease domain-containing protein [Gammaproteobacteria bacterium]
MIKKVQLIRARCLRKNMTDAERMLWSYLQRDQFGVRFRRQVPIGPYIVDFACFDPKIAIECDGGQHQEQHAYDAKRDQFLRQLNFEVIRFWNHEILENIEGVFAVIQSRIESLRQ